jgi:hypothetical protein
MDTGVLSHARLQKWREQTLNAPSDWHLVFQTVLQELEQRPNAPAQTDVRRGLIVDFLCLSLCCCLCRLRLFLCNSVHERMLCGRYLLGEQNARRFTPLAQDGQHLVCGCLQHDHIARCGGFELVEHGVFELVGAMTKKQAREAPDFGIKTGRARLQPACPRGKSCAPSRRRQPAENPFRTLFLQTS